MRRRNKRPAEAACGDCMEIAGFFEEDEKRLSACCERLLAEPLNLEGLEEWILPTPIQEDAPDGQ